MNFRVSGIEGGWYEKSCNTLCLGQTIALYYQMIKMKSTQFQIINVHSEQLKPNEQNVKKIALWSIAQENTHWKNTWIFVILKPGPKSVVVPVAESESPGQPFLWKLGAWTHNHRTYFQSGVKKMMKGDSSYGWYWLMVWWFVCVLFLKQVNQEQRTHMLHIWNIYLHLP